MSSLRARLLLLATTLLLLLGADRLLRWLWYVPVYAEPEADELEAHGMPEAKEFLRFRPHWMLRWTYHPDTTLRISNRSRFTGQRTTWTLATNSLGLRGPEVAVPKPAGVLRVVAVGGSSTSGDGVALEQTYVHQLVGLLERARPGRKVEAVNAGVDGYGSQQGALLYHGMVRRLAPDLLVVALDVNDGCLFLPRARARPWTVPVQDDDRPDLSPEVNFKNMLQDRQQRDGPATRWLARAFGSGLFLSAVYLARLARPTPEPDSASPPLGSLPASTPRCPGRHFGAIARPDAPHMISYYKHMGGLDHLATQDGLPVIYLSVPVAHHKPTDLLSPAPYSSVMAHLTRARDDRAHVDPVAAFCRHPVGRVMLDEFHPTALGHHLIAQALLPRAEVLLAGRGGKGQGEGKKRGEGEDWMQGR